MSRDIGNKLYLLMQSEKALLKLEAAKRSRQLVMSAIGVIAVLAALAMLNVSVYLYFSTRMSPQLAALSLAGLNMLLALLLFWVSSKQTTGAQAQPIQDIRDFAVKQLAKDVEDAKASAMEITGGIQRVSSGVQGVLNRDFLNLGAFIPILQMFLDMRKNKKNKKHEKQTDS